MAEKIRSSNSPNGKKCSFFTKTFFAELQILFLLGLIKKIEKKILQRPFWPTSDQLSHYIP